MIHQAANTKDAPKASGRNKPWEVETNKKELLRLKKWQAADQVRTESIHNKEEIRMNKST